MLEPIEIQRVSNFCNASLSRILCKYWICPLLNVTPVALGFFLKWKKRREGILLVRHFQTVPTFFVGFWCFKCRIPANIDFHLAQLIVSYQSFWIDWWDWKRFHTCSGVARGPVFLHAKMIHDVNIVGCFFTKCCTPRGR